jgi:hypothetical protein
MLYVITSLSSRLVYYKIKDNVIVSSIVNSYNCMDTIYINIKDMVRNYVLGLIFGNITIPQTIPNIKPKINNIELTTKEDVNKFLDEL